MRNIEKFVSGGRNPNIENCCGSCLYLERAKDRSGGWCKIRKMASVSITGGCPDYVKMGD